ncbi:CHASE domain-containing protein [Breoghania sp. L-A4]|uniref:CHASE domain-containing protein n=1 Tax=Breoghania sp. L-A4 TaxID=2304600 RepID=UPI000E359C6C|nr:CHASE domain-containing protein [Breoghania sp. L-A4]AXS40216.1 hypothetical protein D1F64_09290 [Breoghania sp. L-A4]
MNRILPAIVFVVVLAIGIGMTLMVYRAEEAANRARFEIVAGESADRIRDQVRQHVALVSATGAFMNAHPGVVTRPAFDTFVGGIGRAGDFDGLRGIGYARLINTGDEALAEADLADSYDLQRRVWPETTDQAWRTPIVLLSPDDMRNHVALGFDMFSEATRRAAMQAALDSGEMRVSAPVELVQEITEDKQAGFLVYIPYTDIPANVLASARTPVPVAGFVYAPFRAGDLHIAALSRTAEMPVVVETFDTTDGGKTLLYRSSDFAQQSARSAYGVDRSFEIGGRQWTVTIRETAQFGGANEWLNTFVLGAISLLLAAALATSTWFQSKPSPPPKSCMRFMRNRCRRRT